MPARRSAIGTPTLVLSGIAVLALHRSYRGANTHDAMEAETAIGAQALLRR
ncbi:hypothetical protein ACFFOS_18805 [Nocardioides kongjuensis]|uniref:Uncharacterized protein n=1 Tax=Nocardioides kongjuensis TaxID=349522 RepID=A0A852RVQ6_9ACTN|nr:hypothetical protein [Nocardioides kongjuensis]NYD31954.1 hypothetical protein [Nocardioides kongjuensis]